MSNKGSFLVVIYTVINAVSSLYNLYELISVFSKLDEVVIGLYQLRTSYR